MQVLAAMKRVDFAGISNILNVNYNGTTDLPMVYLNYN